MRDGRSNRLSRVTPLSSPQISPLSPRPHPLRPRLHSHTRGSVPRHIVRAPPCPRTLAQPLGRSAQGPRLPPSDAPPSPPLLCIERGSLPPLVQPSYSSSLLRRIAFGASIPSARLSHRRRCSPSRRLRLGPTHLRACRMAVASGTARRSSAANASKSASGWYIASCVQRALRARASRCCSGAHSTAVSSRVAACEAMWSSAACACGRWVGEGAV